ncbi:hypothetical protein A4X13_0g7521 [Tilletia indica]|uniref:Secreted protein n=1 Tax=Tilletia indica TaxID=43049 RepID=A0A8T8SJH5_9BASI|nr:hypothetical protein A4X13_0g7521 [Tilletia indica]
MKSIPAANGQLFALLVVASLPRLRLTTQMCTASSSIEGPGTLKTATFTQPGESKQVPSRVLPGLLASPIQHLVRRGQQSRHHASLSNAIASLLLAPSQDCHRLIDHIWARSRELAAGKEPSDASQKRSFKRRRTQRQAAAVCFGA